MNQKTLQKLSKEWTKRIQNTSGIIYSYVQKELIDSFIKDLEELQNRNLEDYTK